MGSVDNFIEEILDKGPVPLHIPDIHMLAYLLALHSYILKHQVKAFL